jgi:seryl-tRNA synthetase
MTDEQDAAGEVTTVALDRPVPEALGDELARRLYFISPAIAGYELVRAGGAIRSVRLRLDRPADLDQLRRKLHAVVDGDVLAQRRPVPARVWRSARHDRPAAPAFPELVARRTATRPAAGQVALAEPMVSLIDRLDGLLRDIAVTEFGAAPMRYPTLLPTSVLARCGYLTSFPQHVMFATWLHADLDVYREFLAGAERGEDIDALVGRLSAGAGYCLPPTMCYHTFHQFAGGELAGPTTVTARGGSFRFESRYESDLERLWDFTIREIVFLGDRADVTGCRQRFLERTGALLDELGLAGHAEVANDPFFGNARTAEAVSTQLMLALKYEARLYVAADRTVAVGSFNVHDRLFTDAFGIGLPGGEPAASACVGFGLERLAYAVACQHGPDPRGWPELLRTGHLDGQGATTT